MGLEYKVCRLPTDHRAILINPQEGTAGSLGGIDKMQRQRRLGTGHGGADASPWGRLPSGAPERPVPPLPPPLPSWLGLGLTSAPHEHGELG